MAFLLAPARSAQARINDRQVTVQPRETILQAALRSGVEFPNSCRVGACGTCKCRLTDGKVKELTETGYLLSADEIEQGYILACQSVPLSDIHVEVEVAEQPARRTVAGQVVGQDKLTHDITRLTLQLDAPLKYKAGQYALLSMAGLDGVVRSYSFAAPADDSGRVCFLIRRTPGGKFSTLVNDHDVRNREVWLEGPEGDFWLRPGDAPLMFVAGGSGLAPILAILEDAAAAGDSRPATLLFGARTTRDLYALPQIESIAQRWNGEFRFVPILSDEPPGTSWTGAKGLVTDLLAEQSLPGSHAYLCGPPAMVDSARAVLEAKGVDRENVHFDRFTTQADVAKAPETPLDGDDAAPVAAIVGILHYLKYFLFHAVGLLSAASILIGGRQTSLGLLAVVMIYMLGDAVLGDDTSTPKFKRPGILTFQLWLALPLLCFIVYSAVWSVCSGDPLGFGAALTSWTGYDLIAAREATWWPHHIAGWLTTGLMIGMVGTITAHELTHRTWDRVSMFIGRWLLAFSFDTIFSIEHVYGHHRYVSTEDDPATAPRGRNVYRHVLLSTIQGNVSAWKIESDRLTKKRLPVLSWHNAMIRGHLMSVVLVGIAYAMGGWTAALFFAACALWGKSLLEIVNYMEHYGIVRNPTTPVQPRHSWNTNRRVSSWTMFNLTRHSHHHAQGETPYHELRPLPDAPLMINGYLTTIVVALIPPLWHRLMTPKLLAWDRDFATDEERQLAARANVRSNIPALVQAGRAALTKR